MARMSRELVVAIKLAQIPAYRIAQQADLHPAVLSRLIHGAEPVREGDPRVLRVAQILGVPAEQAIETARTPSSG